MTTAATTTANDPFAAPSTSPAATASAPVDAFAGTDPFTAAASAQPAGLSGQDWVIALGVVAAAAIAFYFVRGSVQSSLARSRVAPDAAGGAAWTLFAFLLVLTATVAFGAIGDLWAVNMFLWPAVGLSLLLLVLTAVMFSNALRRRR